MKATARRQPHVILTFAKSDMVRHSSPNLGGAEMADENVYVGKCFCGAVELTVTGTPVAMGYCHCRSCQHWSAGPINTFTLWQPQAVRVTKGGEHVESFQKTDYSVRKFCDTCGGHLYSEHPLWGVTDVYAPVIPDL